MVMKALMTIMILVSTANAAWVSPNYHEIDCEVDWIGSEYSYDGVIDTYTSEGALDAIQPLELYFYKPVLAYKWRIYVNSEIEVWLYYRHDWIRQWAANISYNEWAVKDVWGDAPEPQYIYGAKIISTNPEASLHLHEFQMYEVPEPATILILVGGSVLALRKRRAVI
jgi:hypothetical protein